MIIQNLSFLKCPMILIRNNTQNSVVSQIFKHQYYLEGFSSAILWYFSLLLGSVAAAPAVSHVCSVVLHLECGVGKMVFLLQHLRGVVQYILTDTSWFCEGKSKWVSEQSLPRARWAAMAVLLVVSDQMWTLCTCLTPGTFRRSCFTDS